MKKHTVLVIEDETDILDLVRYHLEREGFAVLTARNGESGLEEAVSARPSLILLDLMLPGIQGLEVCRLLKEREATRSIPIIMLTARGEESDVVIGLGVGADDYVSKPFSVRELAARVQAVLRRSAPRGEEVPSGRIERGNLAIDAGRHEVLLGGEPLSFTLTEFRILHTLVSHPGRVFTRDQLLDRITEGKSVIIDRNIDVHVRSIRRKLGGEADLIVTVRGVGYKLKD